MSELKEENSYSNILKRISAFGGVQIFNIIIGLLRGKFVAMFLGPTGMGISSLYTTSTTPIQQLSGLGLNLAIVREVASSKNDDSLLRKRLSIILRLLFLSSILGVLVCGIGAPLWSHITFGNYHHTISYLWLTLFVALTTAGGGLLAILQGLGEVKRLSKASLVGGLSGLLFGVPLYYFFGDRGIVPAMIILALSTFLFYFISLRKSTAHIYAAAAPKVSTKETRLMMRKLISLGLILLAGQLGGQIVDYLINLFIRVYGSIADIGLFQGANSITNQYVGLIISALALDFFPRLSGCADQPEKMKRVVNRQIEIVLLVGTPLIILLILTSPIIIRLLLTDSFLVITPLMRWLGMGVMIQMFAFPLGYIYVAKDDRKAYIWLECVWTNICWLVCSVFFYFLYGLIGLGISLTVRGLIDLFINYLVCRHRYGFRLSRASTVIVIYAFGFSTVTFLFSFAQPAAAYTGMTIMAILSLTISAYVLRKKIKIKD